MGPYVYALLIEYDGSFFAGWQIQKNQPTVQGALTDACLRLFQEQVSVKGASRTDAGVHALGQVARVILTKQIDPFKLAQALNAVTPRAIRVIKAVKVKADFCPQALNCGKTYHYKVIMAKTAPALDLKRAWYVYQDLDFDRISSCLQQLLGKHDFSAFRQAYCENPNPIKEIYQSSLEIVPKEWETELIFSLQGDGFLKNMVRIMVGTLVDLGRQKLPADAIVRALASKSRFDLGITAPPEGLYLKTVHFPFELFHAPT